MQAFLLSDQAAISAQARIVLLRAGLECPLENVVGLDLATFHLTHAKPELVVLVLPPDVDRSLAVLADVKARSLAHMLVIGPASEVKLVLRALRAGADDYIDQDELEAELEAVLTRWKAERKTQEESGRLIAVLAPSGGSGSSTLAANVATVLAQEHERSALVDLKLHSGDLAALLDLKPLHTLADLCQDVGRMDKVLLERTMVRHDSGVHLLAPPISHSDVGYITPDGIRQALTLARAVFPYVVVDIDHSFREEQALVLRQADIILMVIRLDFASLRNARRALDYLGELGVETDRIRLVVNRHGQPKEVPAAKAEEALGMKITHFVPEDAKVVNRANNNGIPLVLEAPSAKVSKSVSKLAMSVNGQHKKAH